MHYEEHPPPAELRGIVHRIWLLRGTGATGNAPFQRAMPDGRAELIFNLADPFESRDGGRPQAQPLSLLVGPTRRAIQIRPTGGVDLIGVRLRPETLSSWLRVAGGELVDRVFELGTLPAGLDRTLPEELAGAGNSGDRLAVLNRHLAAACGRASLDRRLSAAVDLALMGGRVPPTVIADAVGMSYRQLTRLFQARVGFGPKLLFRLARFQRVLRALERPTPRRLASVALGAGYFDQAHFAGEFRSFAGVPPSRYLGELRDVTRHFIADLESTPA